MSSMWAEIDLRIRTASAAVRSRVGTGPVAIAFVLLAVAYLAAAEIVARRVSAEAGHLLASSTLYWSIAYAMLGDALVALVRAAPVELSSEGKLSVRLGLPRIAGATLALAYLLAALAFIASLAARERFEIRVAETERYSGEAGQFVSRDPPRALSPGPIPVEFTLERVEGRLRPDGTIDRLAATLVGPAGARWRASSLRPVWLGWGRYLRPISAGYAVEVGIRDAGGAELEAMIAKLDLLPPGKRDGVRFTAVPHRIQFTIPDDATALASRAPKLQASVYRGKLAVGGGTLARGESLSFEGVTLQVGGIGHWATFEMVRDPGIGIALLAAGVAVAGGALAWAVRRRAQPKP